MGTCSHLESFFEKSKVFVKLNFLHTFLEVKFIVMKKKKAEVPKLQHVGLQGQIKRKLTTFNGIA